MIVVAGTIRVDPAQRSAAEAAFERMREATLREPGCLAYDAYLDRSDPGTVLIFERWQDDGALQAHFATAHMATFRTALAAVGVRGAEVWKYDVRDASRLM
ncbi:MAG TPA: putative quinol monooxygenase [Candidatus Binatia bacterium]|nr:putative quinol monooxygenase [Candidatus Binatia bacterium]